MTTKEAAELLLAAADSRNLQLITDHLAARYAAGVAEGERRERHRCKMIAFGYPGCGENGSSDCAWNIGIEINSRIEINSSAVSPVAALRGSWQGPDDDWK